MAWFAMCRRPYSTYLLRLLVVALTAFLWSWGCTRPTGKENSPKLDVIPDTLDFGDAYTRLPLTISNLGAGAVFWNIQRLPVGWITVEWDQGMIKEKPTTVDVWIDRERVPNGARQETLVVVGSEGSREEIILKVQNSRSELALRQNSLHFGANDRDKDLLIQNTGTGVLNWTIDAPSEPWLSVAPLEGETRDQPSAVTVTVDPSRVTETGTYTTTLDVSSEIDSLAVQISMEVEHASSSPQLRVYPDSLEFGAASTGQLLDIGNAGAGELAWQAHCAQAWLKVLPASGSIFSDPAQVIVEVDRTLLNPGTHVGYVEITSDGGEAVVPVTVRVPDPVLWLSASEVDFLSYRVSRTLDIANAGGGELTWALDSDCPWLTIEPSRGTATQTAAPVELKAQRQGMAPGVHRAELKVTSNGGTETVVVRLEVTDNPLSVDRRQLDFGAEETTQAIVLWNIEEESLVWEAQEGEDWLTVSPPMGTLLEGVEEITFTVHRQDLPPGTYATCVTIAAERGHCEVTVEMVVPDTLNAAPVAHAGTDQAATADTAVELDGRGSSDPDGDALTYWWVQVEGPPVGLADERAVGTTFTPTEPGRYGFVLIVNDGQTRSFSDQVSIQVSRPPPETGEETTVELPGGTAMDFIWMGPGTFTRGSPETENGRFSNEGPRHEVTLTTGFYLGKYEITQSQWEAVMGDNPSYFQSPDRPVEQVSWDDVQTFIQRLNASTEEAVYRLPTEGEWEYACRAGTTGRWSFGDDEIWLEVSAWYVANNTSAGTKEVGAKQPNPWGLYDMHGNVGEWCHDYFDAYTNNPQIDPSGPASGTSRITRGGYFHSEAEDVRSAKRSRREPANRTYNIGARLVKSKEP